eukprot:GHVH01011838.1.p1 GENE.GHVH01011838.1~~GHVH01011838.1.p1  ORF type:complete len:220 (+),score=32.60 GHVH01011838.1:49-660(+)
MPARDYDALFKLVLVGDISVGKSCLLIKFADDSFSDSYIATIGVDFRFRSLKVDDKVVKLQIWDTAGQERFRTITSAYYKGADGIIVVYDCSSEASYNAIDGWLDEISHYNGPEYSSILIVGNKSDLEKKEVEIENARLKYSDRNITVIESSAKTGDGVEEAFTAITRTLLDRRAKETAVDDSKWNANVALSDEDKQPNNCCL